MNDEIKEILKNIKKVANCETASRNTLMEMKDTDYQLLLDYITNLQQENEKLLSENIAIKSVRNMVDETIYKSRIEKAIEYIKSQEDNLFMSFSDDFLDHDELITRKIGMTLLNILNGRSDE